MADYKIIQGECLDVLRDMEDNSIDAVVTDPPYGLSNTSPQKVAETIAKWATGEDEYIPKSRGFMGAEWDGFVPPPAVWKECLRVLKPGGHMLVFAGSRTQDLMGMSVRLAGFDVRDNMAWITGSGFPKGQDLGKQIDRKLGKEREVIGTYSGASNIGKKEDGKWGYGITGDSNAGGDFSVDVTLPASEEAKKWTGWSSQLKPSHEPIIVARKPFKGSLVENVMNNGVGAINVDDSRVPVNKEQPDEAAPEAAGVPSGGRYPANVVLDEHAAEEMDRQSGWKKDATRNPRERKRDRGGVYDGGWKSDYAFVGYGGEGGASRFFHVFKYQSKAPKSERPTLHREDGEKVQHATVKPLKLMEHLVKLVTPAEGLVLDPFAGSGTTLQAARDNGFRSVGIEQDPDFCDLIEVRMGEKNEERREER